jgi:predicted dehydrogenase
LVQERLRVGIAGAGWVALNRHAPVILAHPYADLVAVYDRDLVRAQAFCAQFAPKGGAPRIAAYGHLDQFLDERFDVVHVTTSPWSHHDLTVAALSAASHVFVEKPMAMGLSEAKSMADQAREAGRLLCVSHNFLWSWSMAKALRALGQGPVDYLLGLQMSAMTRRLPAWHSQLPGGLMFDEIPHMLYSANRLLGGDLVVDHVRADRAQLQEGDYPRTVEVLLGGRTGHGQVTMVLCSPVSEWHIMASAMTGFVDIDLFRDVAIRLVPDGRHGPTDIARSSVTAVAGHVGGFVRSGARYAAHRQFWGHDELIGRFFEAVHNGNPAPVPIDDALTVVTATDHVLSALGVQMG